MLAHTPHMWFLRSTTWPVHACAQGPENATDGRSAGLWTIDQEALDSENNTLVHGIRMTDGDATVPLISSGVL